VPTEASGELHRVAKRGARAGQDVRAAERAAIERCHDPGREVVDVDESDADVVEGPIRELAVVGGRQLLPERRGVAGSIDLAGHGDHDRGALRDARLGDLVGAVLRLVVPAHEPCRRIPPEVLVDDGTVRVAEHVHGRDTDDPGHTGGRRGVQDAGGGADVRLPHRRPLVLPDADAVAAGRVDQGVRHAERAHEPTNIREVVGDHRRPDVAQPSSPVWIPNERDDLVVAVAERGRDRAAHEPGSPGEDDAHTGRPARQ
jgi:hypothetical protein